MTGLTSEIKACYMAHPRVFNGMQFLVVYEMENDREDTISVTNSIELISEKHGLPLILYRDTTDTWDAWHKDKGFILLGVEQKEPGVVPDEAINRLYFKIKNSIP